MNGAGSGAQVALRLDGITKRFGALTANDAIGFTLDQGEVIALLGENGAGKTTLMNILFGHYVADAGHIEVFGKPLPPGHPAASLAAGIGMVHQHFMLADHLSVLENIVLGTRPIWLPGFNRRAARQKIAGLARDFGLDVDPDARAGALTVGERQRVEILKALYRDARILILDEPTAVLTPQETEALFATLRRAVGKGLSIIFISHKLHEVLAIAARVIVLRHGQLIGEVRAADTDRHKLAEMMVGREVPAPRVTPKDPGAPRMRFAEVSTPDRGNRPGLKEVTLDLCAGQILGIAGVSGNGQGALADVISGLESPVSGTLSLGDDPVGAWSPRQALKARIGRIPEDRHKTGGIDACTLTENAVLESYDSAPVSRRGWMHWGVAEAQTRAIIDRYDVRCPGPDTTLRLLSGGNIQKLILGRVLEAGPRIILANQPVRGLDIGALTYVHEQLLAARAEGAAILLISEDLDEIMALSDVIHVISRGRLSPGFGRGSKTPAELGLWMAGHWFEGTDHAA